MEGFSPVRGRLCVPEWRVSFRGTANSSGVLLPSEDNAPSTLHKGAALPLHDSNMFFVSLV